MASHSVTEVSHDLVVVTHRKHDMINLGSTLPIKIPRLGGDKNLPVARLEESKNN